MKSNIVLSSLVATFAYGASALAAETYNIDPAHSSVGFGVSHMVINTVRGKFNEFTGTVTVDGKEVKDAKGTIQTKSIDTGVANRDKHLRSGDFFDVEKYPTITFVSKKAEMKDGQTVLTGDFTMHGVTKELSIPVKVKGPIKDMMGMQRIGLEGRTEISRKDYGLTWNKALETGGVVVGDEVELQINAEATKAR